MIECLVPLIVLDFSSPLAFDPGPQNEERTVELERDRLSKVGGFEEDGMSYADAQDPARDPSLLTLCWEKSRGEAVW